MGWFVAAIACLAIGIVLVRRARRPGRRALADGHYGDGTIYVPASGASDNSYGGSSYGDSSDSGGGGAFGGGGAGASWGDAGASSDSSDSGGGGDGGGGGGGD